jgi:hypothetical protein
MLLQSKWTLEGFQTNVAGELVHVEMFALHVRLLSRVVFARPTALRAFKHPRHHATRDIQALELRIRKLFQVRLLVMLSQSFGLVAVEEAVQTKEFGMHVLVVLLQIVSRGADVFGTNLAGSVLLVIDTCVLCLLMRLVLFLRLK